VSRYMKITKVVPAPAPMTASPNGEANGATIDETKKAESEAQALEPPHLGYVSIMPLFGGTSRNYSDASGGTPSYSGGGFNFTGVADGEIWFDRNWFVNLGFAYGIGPYGQNSQTTATPSTATVNGGVTESLFSFKVNAGYSFLVTGDFFGPKAWLKAGYQLDNWYMPNDRTESTGGISYSAPFLGIGGDVPI